MQLMLLCPSNPFRPQILNEQLSSARLESDPLVPQEETVYKQLFWYQRMSNPLKCM